MRQDLRAKPHIQQHESPPGVWVDRDSFIYQVHRLGGEVNNLDRIQQADEL